MARHRAVAALLIALSALSAVSARDLHVTEGSIGRKLLDINVQGTDAFGLTAFGTGNAPGGNCYLQGYPGGRADETVAGPLTVNVYPGDSTTIYFSRGSDSFFANYNYSGNIDVISVSQNQTYGLASATFKPQAAGQYVNIFSGLVSTGSPITSPTCLVNITFTAANRPPPPPTPSPPPATPSPPPPSSTPSPNSGTCTGVIPCYCQNGYCFNNGATLSPNCIPPAGQTCRPTTVAPSSIGVQYAFGYGSSVNVCKCS